MLSSECNVIGQDAAVACADVITVVDTARDFQQQEVRTIMQQKCVVSYRTLYSAHHMPLCLPTDEGAGSGERECSRGPLCSSCRL